LRWRNVTIMILIFQVREIRLVTTNIITKMAQLMITGVWEPVITTG
jgi:hypothetical protein